MNAFKTLCIVATTALISACSSLPFPPPTAIPTSGPTAIPTNVPILPAPTETPLPTAAVISTVAATETPFPAATAAVAKATGTAVPTPEPIARPTVTPAVQDSSYLTPNACTFERPEGIAQREVACGFVTLPEDPARPEGRKIRLAIAHFKSRASKPAEPLFYLSGGPGSSGIEEGLEFFTTIVGRMIYFRDVVLIDQRGTGGSIPSLDCPLYRDYSRGFLISRQNLTKKELQRQRQAALEQCLSTIQTRDIDPILYITRNSAADIDGIRRALNYEKIVLWGTSYGTTLALEVMRNHGEHVRSVVLESPAPPQVNLLEQLGFRASRAFNTLFKGCRESSQCDRAYPDLDKTFYRVVERLDKRPTRITLNRGPRRINITLDGGDFASLVFLGMYSTPAIEYLPAIIASVDRRNYDALDPLLDYSAVASVQPGAGLYYSVMCAEEGSFTDAGKLAEMRDGHKNIKSFLDDATFETCQRWPHAQLNEADIAPVRSDIPTLILTGEYDPTTPPEWGALIATDLNSSYLFEFPGFGHGIVGTKNECANRILLDFVQAPDTRPVSSGCIDDLRPPIFYSP